MPLTKFRFTTATSSPLIEGVRSSTQWDVARLTYAFPDSPNDYNYNWEPNSGFQVTTMAQRNAVRTVLDTANGRVADNGFAVEGFTRLKIEQGSQQTATIKVAESSRSMPTAYAYLPGSGEVAGDVWFGNRAGYENPKLGTYYWATVAHELGHALGLKHGHEGSDKLPRAYDSQEYSIMTYRSYVGGHTNYITYGANSAPQTFMMADIAALQHFYGANYTVNSGETRYSWRQNDGRTFVNGQVALDPTGTVIFATIWDGGGEDTYNLSDFTRALTIDLTPGGYSRFGSGQLADLGGGPNNGHARGHIFNALLHNNDTRSLIENAIGGSGNDAIKGNVGDNRLEGRNGNDTLTGMGGDDELSGMGGNDRMRGNAGSDEFRFRDGWGNDRILDFVAADDTIAIDDFASAAAALAAAVDDGFGNVVITTTSGSTLTLVGVAVAELSTSDFVIL